MLKGSKKAVVFHLIINMAYNLFHCHLMAHLNFRSSAVAWNTMCALCCRLP